LHFVSEGAGEGEEVGVEEVAGAFARDEAKCEERAPVGFAQGKSRGASLTTRESEIEERSLHSVARRAKIARKKMPGYSGRDDTR